LEGDIEDIIQICISQDQQERLEELAVSPEIAEGIN
jgi:peptide chain release factor 1